MSGILCPNCKRAELDTITSAPYIRGMLLAYTYGTKRFVGCQSCVRKQLAGEVGLSLVIGWFSITSLLVNPMCILWNTFRLPFVKPDPRKIQELLTELGVDVEASAGPVVDIPRVAAALAVAMVNADGKIDDTEVAVAVAIGERLFESFDVELFSEVLLSVNRLPGPSQSAALLREYLTDEGKVAVQRYLIAIATADGEIDSSEIELLKSVSYALGLEPPDLKPGPCEKPF